jgi:hypothetical protein
VKCGFKIAAEGTWSLRWSPQDFSKTSQSPEWCPISIAKDYGGTQLKLTQTALYEAAVLALRTFNQHDCAPWGDMTRLEVEIRSSVVHETTVRRVREWLSVGARSPK